MYHQQHHQSQIQFSLKPRTAYPCCLCPSWLDDPGSTRGCPGVTVPWIQPLQLPPIMAGGKLDANMESLMALKSNIDGQLKAMVNMLSAWFFAIHVAGAYIFALNCKVLVDDVAAVAATFECTWQAMGCRTSPPFPVLVQQFMYTTSTISMVAHIMFLTRDKIDIVFAPISSFNQCVFMSSMFSFSMGGFAAYHDVFFSPRVPYGVIWYVLTLAAVFFLRRNIATVQKGRNEVVKLMQDLEAKQHEKEKKKR